MQDDSNSTQRQSSLLDASRRAKIRKEIAGLLTKHGGEMKETALFFRLAYFNASYVEQELKGLADEGRVRWENRSDPRGMVRLSGKTGGRG